MRARGLAGVLALVAGCGGSTGPGPGTGAPTGTPGGAPVSGTTTPPTEPPVGATCAVRPDNALIADCTAWLPDDGPAAAFLEDPAGALRALEATQDGRRLDVVAWRLHESTAYTVRIQPTTGAALEAAFTTGALPPEASVATVVTGTPGFDHVLVPQECGAPALLLLDHQGRVVWYLLVAAEGMTGVGFATVDGFQHTPDDTVLAVLGRTRVREWTWTQELRLDLAWPGALPGPVHHDVARWNGHTYVLTAEEVTGADGIDYVMDGVLVFGPAQDLVTSWWLSDHYAPSGGLAVGGGFWQPYFPGAWDWAHSNGIFVDSSGDLLLSSREFHTVLKVAFDWTAPQFGDVVWAFTADPASPLGSDFALQGAIAPLNFSDQHHPNLDGAGQLLLFDNRGLFAEESRATRWDLDPAGGTATLRAAWAVGEHCSVQGSAFPLANDHVLATCAQSQRISEFSPLQADPVFTMDVPCASGGGGSLMVRAIPVDFAVP